MSKVILWNSAIKTRGRFSAAEALDVLTPIMSVLDTAHSMGVVHRDLKPENIMIGKPDETGKPVVKLLDLGIAKMREIAGDNGGNTALTTAGQVLGTPYYMSPEQWGEIPRDGNEEIDGRADIYSLGLVFYEMLAGRRCFAGNTLHELRREHVTAKPKPLRDVCLKCRAVSVTLSSVRSRRIAATARQAPERWRMSFVQACPRRAARLRRLAATRRRFLVDTAAIDAGAVATNADVTAPTILTLDPAPTSPVGGRPAPTGDATVTNRQSRRPQSLLGTVPRP
jgi:serine/threonine protein kinase